MIDDDSLECIGLMATRFETVDAYIEAQPADVRPRLEKLRAAILSAAPDVAESVRYDMPSYKLNGRPMISFAAWKNHIGLYPVHALDEELEREVAPMRAAKSTVQLLLSKPFPRELVDRMLVEVAARTMRLGT